MGQKDRKGVVRDIFKGLFKVVAFVIMGIICSYNAHCRTVFFQCKGIVNEHVDSGIFKLGSDFQTVVVPQNPKNPIACVYMPDQITQLSVGVRRTCRAEHTELYVSPEEAQAIAKAKGSATAVFCAEESKEMTL